MIDIGKSISGIFTGKFENISQVQTAIGSGGVIDTFSDLIDKASNKIYQKGIISRQIKSVITSGKDIILNNVTIDRNNLVYYYKFIMNSIEQISNIISKMNSAEIEQFLTEMLTESELSVL